MECHAEIENRLLGVKLSHEQHHFLIRDGAPYNACTRLNRCDPTTVLLLTWLTRKLHPGFVLNYQRVTESVHTVANKQSSDVRALGRVDTT